MLSSVTGSKPPKAYFVPLTAIPHSPAAITSATAERHDAAILGRGSHARHHDDPPITGLIDATVGRPVHSLNRERGPIFRGALPRLLGRRDVGGLAGLPERPQLRNRDRAPTFTRPFDSPAGANGAGLGGTRPSAWPRGHAYLPGPPPVMAARHFRARVKSGYRCRGYRDAAPIRARDRPAYGRIVLAGRPGRDDARGQR